MKKRIGFTVMMSALFLACFTPIFAAEDTTPPQISNITMDKREFKGGESVVFSFSGTDDLSGIDTYMMEYTLKSDPSKRISIQIYNNSNTNNFSQSYTIPTTLKPGEWQFEVVQVWDTAGNLNTYYRNTTDESVTINFSGLDFTLIEDPAVDLTFPVLQSVSISPQEVKAPGSFTVTVKATDNVSQNLHVSVYMGGINTGTDLTKKSGNTYSTTFNITAEDKYKKIKIEQITLTDEQGNSVTYTHDMSNGGSDFERRPLPKEYLVKISGITTADTTAPTLINYKKEHSVVGVPGVYRPTIEVTDDISGFERANISIVKVESVGNYSLGYIANLYDSSKNGNKYSGELIFDQFEGESTYLIESIELIDYAGNSSIYAINASDPNYKIPEKTFSLKRNDVSNVSTGTMTDDYESVIKDSNEDSIISIDSTKNSIVKASVFESIRNTSKTIIINNSGIEWVFNGKDIVNASKDIDSKITISTFVNGGDIVNIESYIQGGNGIIIEFPANGLLPGKALVKIKADYTLRNYMGDTDLYVYYYNQEDNGLEAVANKINISSAGYYEFYITHNSTYIISSKKANAVIKDASAINETINNDVVKPEDIIEVKEKEVVEETPIGDVPVVVAPINTKNTINPWILTGVLLTGTGIATYVYLRKKKSKSV
ncbi:hypothetical protein AOC36_08775 [Erysipelothrix larvae]|uniref:Bacterial Ig-like domain-containing protein n=1 Tax=Erysipelothrix larvae TaxID=1514105 RepID=A0A109UHG5_9FIRM|nr:hypothetical protein [Erysipelothrix larvae]AMC94078.1 hypothetical protein AOC36_08775 [Erysipelothrix larvae]